MSDTFVVNLFHNGLLKFSGFKKGMEPDSKGGVRPQVVPINVFRKARKFPYRLDEDKNVKRFSNGSVDIEFLVPTKDVPNLNESQYRKSLYYRLVGESGSDAEELREKLESKDKKIGKLKKELRKLEAEKEEQNKGGSGRGGGGRSLRCPECGSSNPESQWDRQGGVCPSCGLKDKMDMAVQSV